MKMQYKFLLTKRVVSNEKAKAVDISSVFHLLLALGD